MHLPLKVTKDIKIFFVHSQSRDDERLRVKLEKHLSGLIALGVDMKWLKHEIKGGQDWKEKIYKYLNIADIIVMLVSPDLVHLVQYDEFWNNVARQARKQEQEEEPPMIPVLLRSIHGWQNIQYFQNIHPLPKNGEAADSKKTWKNCGEAFREVAQGLEEKIKALKEYKQKLQDYANQVFQEVQQEYPITTETIERLQQLQKNLDIRQQDADLIEIETIQRFEAGINQNKQKKVLKNATATGIIAASAVAVFILSGSYFSYSMSKSAEDFFNECLSYYQNKNFDAAIEKCTQAIKREPNSTKYYNTRGNTYFVKNNWEAAIKDYNQTIQLDSANVHAYRFRGEALAKLGYRQEAIEDLSKAASLYEEQGKTYDYQAVLKAIKKLQQ